MVTRPSDEVIQIDRIALANTRPVLPFGMPWPWMIATALGPPLLMLITFKPVLLSLWLPMVLVGRLVVARDHNMPRIWWLWLTSGAAFADRTALRGDSPPAFASPDKWLGNYHG